MGMGGGPVFALSVPKSPTGRSSDSRPESNNARLSDLASALLHFGGYAVDDKGGALFTAAKDAMYIKMEMPGVSREDVKVFLDGMLLVIKGEIKPDPELEGDRKSTPKIYIAKISMITLMNTYKTREMKAEMKNGVLKIKIPMIEEMEREDIVNVKVD